MSIHKGLEQAVYDELEFGVTNSRLQQMIGDSRLIEYLIEWVIGRYDALISRPTGVTYLEVRKRSPNEVVANFAYAIIEQHVAKGIHLQLEEELIEVPPQVSEKEWVRANEGAIVEFEDSFMEEREDESLEVASERHGRFVAQMGKNAMEEHEEVFGLEGLIGQYVEESVVAPSNDEVECSAPDAAAISYFRNEETRAKAWESCFEKKLLTGDVSVPFSVTMLEKWEHGEFAVNVGWDDPDQAVAGEKLLYEHERLMNKWLNCEPGLKVGRGHSDVLGVFFQADRYGHGPWLTDFFHDYRVSSAVRKTVQARYLMNVGRVGRMRVLLPRYDKEGGADLRRLWRERFKTSVSGTYRMKMRHMAVGVGYRETKEGTDCEVGSTGEHGTMESSSPRPG